MNAGVKRSINDYIDTMFSIIKYINFNKDSMKAKLKRKDLIIFATIWAAIFAVIGIYPISVGEQVRSWALGISIFFILIASLKPSLLTSFYNVWIKVGEFIGGIISKVFMFFLYFGMFTPIAFVLKVIGKDLLRKKVDKTRSTYWINRESQPQSMKNQF